MNKLITSTGFFNTGSSAITDILQEFKVVNNKGDVNEIRLLYETDCISDLEYNLVDNPHRHNTSNAIKLFKKFIDFSSNPLLDHHYEQIFNGNFKKISYKYINELCDFVYNGVYHGDVYNKGKIFWFLNRCYQKLIRIVFSTKKMPSWVSTSLLNNNEQAFAGTFSEKKFLSATNKYVSDLLETMGKNSEFYLIDQFLPPTNLQRYLRYIPSNLETKVFIIDRDPVDLYLTDKYFFYSGVIPSYDVNVYCNWFLWTRGQSEKFEIPENVLRLNFEDMIYRYNETREKICSFVGLDINSECKQFTCFDPKKSINNTQLIKRFQTINKDEVNTIRDRLGKYCYKFPTDGLQPDYSKMNLFSR